MVMGLSLGFVGSLGSVGLFQIFAPSVSVDFSMAPSSLFLFKVCVSCCTASGPASSSSLAFLLQCLNCHPIQGVFNSGGQGFASTSLSGGFVSFMSAFVKAHSLSSFLTVKMYL